MLVGAIYQLESGVVRFWIDGRATRATSRWFFLPRVPPPAFRQVDEHAGRKPSDVEREGRRDRRCPSRLPKFLLRLAAGRWARALGDRPAPRALGNARQCFGERAV
jgi:hypothetical protein